MFMHVVNMSMHVACRVAQVCCNAHGIQRTWYQYSLPTGGGGLLRGQTQVPGLCSNSSAVEKDLVLLRQGLILWL